MARSFPRIIAVVAVAGSLVLAGCGSDDSSDNGSDTPAGEPARPSRDTSVEPREEYAAYCDDFEEIYEADLPPIESAQRQLETAPDELKEDIQLMLDWVELRDGDTEADPDALAEAEAAGQPAFMRVVTSLQQECGITVPIM